ncbi:RNA polymerase sigma factor, partial [Kitasatospora sp. NPDC001574]
MRTSYGLRVSASNTATSEPVDRLDALFRLHGRRLVGFITGLVNDSDRPLAEDLAQEVWIQAGRAVHGLRLPDERAFSWLAVVARHTVGQHYRRKGSHEIAMDWSDPVAVRSLDANTAPADEPADLPGLYRPIIEALPDEQRTALMLRLDGLSYRAAAARTGLSDRCIRNRVS